MIAVACVVALGGALPGLAKDADGPVRRLQSADLFRLELAQDPQISPDGAVVAYVRTDADIMTDSDRRTIWLVDAATGEQSPLAATGASFSPRWSPDGAKLAYVSTADGRPQLFVRWIKSGATARITELPSSPTDIAWSPDGKTIAFSMMTTEAAPAFAAPGLGAPAAKPEGAKWAEPLRIYDTVTYRFDGAGYLTPGFSHLFVVPADGGAPRQLTFGRVNEEGRLRWAPDGRSLVYSANHDPDWAREADQSQVYELSLADGTQRQLTHRQGTDQSPDISPDGSKIAYLGYDAHRRGYENVQLYVMDRNGENARSLTASLDRSASAPRWAADGRGVYFLYVDHGVSKLAEALLDGKIRELAAGMSGAELDRPYSGGSYSASRGGVAFTQGAPDEPGDVALLAGGVVKRLTHLNDSLFAAKALGKVTHLAVSSSAGGLPIDAWMITPPDFNPQKKYPLILEIHGGPYSSYGPVFASELQLYAAAGYVVLYANPRGSTSYGFAFADAINDNYPSNDYDDLMSAVDAAVATGFVDKDNLFVTGGSGGGLLTAWIVGKTHRFRAAVAQKPVINWTSEVLTTDAYPFMAQDWFSKMPWEDPDGYWRRSPLSLVGAVTTPTLLMVGTDDHRTPPSEAEQYYQALQLRGVPTALVQVPGASHHGLADRPSQEAAEAGVILGWFARYRSEPTGSSGQP